MITSLTHLELRSDLLLMFNLFWIDDDNHLTAQFAAMDEFAPFVDLIKALERNRSYCHTVLCNRIQHTLSLFAP